MPLKNHCCVLRESRSALQELRGALQESRTVPGTSLAFFNSFQKPHMLTALVMAFDNAEIRTVISGDKRTVVLVCYVQEVFAHSTVHLTFYFIILEPRIFLHPVSMKPTAKHFPLFLMLIQRCCNVCIVSLSLAFLYFVFSLFWPFIAIQSLATNPK